MAENKLKIKEDKKDKKEEKLTKEELEVIEKRKNEILGILIIALGLLSAIAIFTPTEAYVLELLKNIYKSILGTGSLLLPILLIIWGLTLIRLRQLSFNLRLAGFLLAYLSIIAIIHTYKFPGLLAGDDFVYLKEGGGLIGGAISFLFYYLFASIGTYIILSTFLLIGILLWFDILLNAILIKIKKILFLTINKIKIFFKNIYQHKKDEKEIEESKEEIIEESIFDNYNEEIEEPLNNIDINEQDEQLEQTEKIETEENKETEETEEIKEDENKELKIVKYKLPGLNLFKDFNRRRKKPTNKSQVLEETLLSFGVKAKVIKVNHGPTITRYELQPATGVKVSKIISLADDIALALAAAAVRIEAPIPGKAAVGIEIPHMNNIIVRLKDIIKSKEFNESKSILSLALGMGIDGQAIIADLAKMPHLLVAGATGSGKSVCVNTIIASILFKGSPDEVKFILIDPKKVELNNYKGLPHLFAPVVTDPKKAANVLKLVVEEMENRYELFSETNTRGINSYNQKVKKEDKLPYIVVIIDELSDLMMVAATEVEDNICRLAQMARAAGIHLVIATQRPSVDVITGLIKANIPSRISFAVSSQTDSRTILDMGGAEKLLGNGDMLLALAGTQKFQRIQGAYIDNDEINMLVDFIKNQANPDYEFDFKEIKEVELSTNEESDELYEKAIKLVVNYRASISMLQRRLHIGHSRAARLIDMMEENGIVGPYVGSKPREVLISKEDLDDYLETSELSAATKEEED